MTENRTRLAYVATRVLDTPFWAIYNLLPVILYKDLHATPMQIAAMISLKPLVSLISMYWSCAIHKRPDRLVSNILWARILGYLPFFCFPFVDNCWFFVFAFGLYMMFTVAIVPAWMELLKRHVPGGQRESLFSYTQAFGYLGGGLIPFIVGWLMDEYSGIWRWLFPAVALLALTASFFQRRIVVSLEGESPLPITIPSLWTPWIQAWKLMKERSDFRRFQMGFMVIGCGLMLIAPALPSFLVDGLHLSYTELASAITVCRGIGFVIASPFWSRWMPRVNVYRLTAWIAMVGCLFPFALFLSQLDLVWLYIGYLLYGAMQAGNELVWNMSGPLFAKEGDSSVYTSVNILSIGLRGCFIPALGSYLSVEWGSSSVMLISGILFLLAAVAFLMRCGQRESAVCPRILKKVH